MYGLKCMGDLVYLTLKNRERGRVYKDGSTGLIERYGDVIPCNFKIEIEVQGRKWTSEFTSVNETNQYIVKLLIFI